MAAHRMAHDPLPVHVGREILGDQRRQLLGDVGVHPVIGRERRLGRIDVEAGALAEIIGLVVGHALAARAGVGRDEDQAELGAGPAILALLGDIGVGAGEPGQIPDHRQFADRPACGGTKTEKVIGVPVSR